MAKSDGDGHNGKALVFGAVGGLTGAGLMALFSGRPAAAAPADTRLDYITTLLEALLKQNSAMLDAIKGISLLPGGTEINLTVLTPWIFKDPESIFDQGVRSVGVLQTDRMVDCRRAKLVIIKAESSLDQAVALQAVGNDVDSFDLATNIGVPQVCPANGNRTLGFYGGARAPFIGLRITAAVAPLSGLLTIRASIQE